MLKRFEEFIVEGYSNNNGILQKMQEKFEIFLKDNWNKIQKGKTSSITLYEKVLNKEKIENLIYLYIEIGNISKESQITYNDKTKEFEIYIKFTNQSYDQIISIFTHEVTHLSQWISGFKDYVDKNDWNKFTTQKTYSSFSSYYNNVSHSQREDEHEAVLIQTFELIKRKAWKDAAKEIYNRAPYYSKLNRKTFLKKAYSYGLSLNDIHEISKYYKKEFESEFFDLPIDVQYEEVLDVQINTLYLFNIDYKQYLEKINNELLDDENDYSTKDIIYHTKQLNKFKKNWEKIYSKN